MAEPDLSKFSGQQIKQLTNFKKEISAVYETNFDLIIQRKNDNYFDFVSSNGKFHWAVTNIQPPVDANVWAIVTFVPSSFNSITRGTATLKLQDAVTTFNNWIKDVISYNDALNEYHDPFSKQFEKEFEDSFGEETEEDKHTTLSSDEQLKVYKLLSFIEEGLKKEDTSKLEIQNLIAFTNDFKEKIPFLPKSALKKRAIKLISDLKRFGSKLYHDTIEIGYKETIKAVLLNGAHAIASGGAGHIISQVLQ